MKSIEGQFSRTLVIFALCQPCSRCFHIILDWRFDLNNPAWGEIDSYLDAMCMQFSVEQCVHMMNPWNNKQKVASGKISGVGGVDKFHFKTIPEFCYKVDVSAVHLGEVRLPYPHEARDQWVAEDVVGGNTLWNERNLRAAWFPAHIEQVEDVGHEQCEFFPPIRTCPCIWFGSEE